MGVFSKAFGLDDAGDAARANREAAELQKRLAEAGLAKQRKRTIAEARIASAALVAKAGATGGAGSSGLAGTQSAIRSQTGEVVSFSGTQKAFGEAIFQKRDEAARAQERGARRRAITGLAIQGIQAYAAS